MNSAFQKLTDRKPSILQALLKKQPKENAVVRINNLLADSGDIRQVSEGAVFRIASEHRLKLGSELIRDFNGLYAQHLQHCLSDGMLSTVETEELRHLKKILRVSDGDAAESHDKIAGAIYRSAVNEAVADGFLSVIERTHLERLRIDLNISADLARKIYADVASSALRGFFDVALADKKLSPKEDAELRSMAESLGFNITHDAKTQDLIETYRTFWHIEEGNLPILVPEINVQRNEVCHAHVQAQLHELRRVTTRTTYGGYSTSYKVFKGFYLRGGNYSSSRQTQDVLTKLDSGDLYLTNKRLIFMGNQKNITIRTPTILSFTQYNDGIEIEKGSGKNPFFFFTENLTVFGKILKRVVQESNGSETPG